MKLKHVAVVPVLALTVSLAGCGSDKTSTTSPSTSPSTQSGSASAAPSTSTSATLSPGAAVDAKAFVAPIRAAIKAAGSYHMSQTVSTDPGTMVGMITRKDGKVAFQAKAPGTEMRYVNGDAYMQMDELGAGWLKFDKASTNPEVKSTLAGIKKVAESDEDEFTVYEASKVTFVGAETEGKHYRLIAPADVFYDKAVDADAKTDAGAPVDRAADKAALAGKTVTIDVWLNAKSELNKSRTDSSSLSGITLSAPKKDVVLVRTTTFTAWGEPVTVAAPPAADTVEAGATLG